MFSDQNDTDAVHGQSDFLEVAELLKESERLRNESSEVTTRLEGVHSRIMEMLKRQGVRWPIGVPSDPCSREDRSGEDNRKTES